MLQSLRLSNFKLFDAQGITVAPSMITVFIGANGTGKSSIFQALQLLKQNSESAQTGGFAYNGHELTLGSFDDIIHGREFEQQIQISMDVPYAGLTKLEHLVPRVPSDGTFTYTVHLGNTIGYSHACSIHDDCRTYVEVKQKRRLEVIPDEFSFDGAVKFKAEVISNIGRPIEMRPIEFADTGEAEALIRDIHLLLSTIQVQLSNSHFTPAIRGFDQLHYDIYSSGARFTEGSNAILRSRALANLIAERPDIAEEVGRKIQQVIGAGDRTLRHRLVGQRVSPELGTGRQSVTLLNEAFGLNQLIPAMAELVMAKQGALVAIEEPEAHLHPRAQAALAEAFVGFALEEHKQVMLTTHSEHILMSLLGAVARGRIGPGDVAVYEMYREGDAARAKRLTVNKYGQIEGGLREFLEVDIEKISELVASRFR